MYLLLLTVNLYWLTLKALTPQNGQTHSNNLPTNCLNMFDQFVGLALKGLKCKIINQSGLKEIKKIKGNKSFSLLHSFIIRPKTLSTAPPQIPIASPK